MISSTKTKVDKKLAVALEESEAVYWSKYYHTDDNLLSFASIISGAFVSSVPELDILAMNRVIGLGIRNEVNPSDIGAIIDFYKKAGAKRFFIQLSDYTVQDDLPFLLEKAGFRFHNRWSKLMKKLDVEPILKQSELYIKKITKELDMRKAYGQILFDSFDWEDSRLKNWLIKPINQIGYHNYLAYQGETPIAAGALHLMGSYASLAFAGTLPSYRGLGAQRALIDFRLKEAYKAGCEYAFTETGVSTTEKPVQSYLNMIKLGFEEVYQRDNWIIEL